MKNLISLFALAIVLYSCNGTEESLITPTGNELSPVDLLALAEPIDYSKLDQLILSASSVTGTLVQVDLAKQLKESANGRSALPSISLNEQILKPDTRSMIYNYIDNTSGARVVDQVSFGSMLKFSFHEESPNGRSSSSDYEVYNPELITITNREEIKQFSNDSDLLLTWEPDVINSKPITLQVILRTVGESKEILILVSMVRS